MSPDAMSPGATGPGATTPDAGRPGGPEARRTRIVLAQVARGGRAPTEFAEQGPVRDALLRGLVRAQLAHALRFAVLVLTTLGGLPILFALAPSVAQARVLGVSLPWLLLGAFSFPLLYGAGAAYVRVAERTEQEFTDLVEHPQR